MARPELEYPAQRVGTPDAQDIYRGSFIRVYNDDGTIKHIEWSIEMWFRDKDGNTIGVVDPTRQRYRIQLTEQGVPSIPDIVAEAIAELGRRGFTVVP
jgi:hypothetical protein